MEPAAEAKRVRGRPKKISRILAIHAEQAAEEPALETVVAETKKTITPPLQQQIRKRGRPPNAQSVPKQLEPPLRGIQSPSPPASQKRKATDFMSSSSGRLTGLMRARDHGIVFRGAPGHFNNITDVPGTSVGYTTITSRDQQINTGVTVIFPRGSDKPCVPAAAGVFSFNGNGELTGSHMIDECGAMQSPILLTNTASVGTAHRGIVNWINKKHPTAGGEWILPVVAETFDGWLSNIVLDILDGNDVAVACDSARGGCTIDEGNVGGGTGMITYDFKGGSGSASRRVDYRVDAGRGPTQSYTVGVFVQSNFGRRHELTICGVHLGEALKADNPRREAAREKEGSIIVVVATDAPLLPHQCKALARRATFGVARTGTCGSHFSGDLFIAYSTANEGAFTSSVQPNAAFLDQVQTLPWGSMDPLFEAVVQATEEAIVNAMVAGEEMVGFRGRRVPALPVAAVVRELKLHRAI